MSIWTYRGMMRENELSLFGKSTIVLLVAWMVFCFLSFTVNATEDSDHRFAHLPQFPALEAKIYGGVGTKLYVTDARGNVVKTTSTTNYQIRNIEYSKDTQLANVTLVSNDFTIIIQQEWRYKENDWALNNPDKSFEKVLPTPRYRQKGPKAAFFTIEEKGK